MWPATPVSSVSYHEHKQQLAKREWGDTLVVAILAEDAKGRGETAFEVLAFFELVVEDRGAGDGHLDFGVGGAGLLAGDVGVG